MKSILKPLLMITAMALGMTASAILPAWALVEINVNKGNVEPLPIAITDFQGGDALGAQISEIKGVLQPQFDARQGAGNFSRDEVLAAHGRLVIKEDAVASV